MAYVVFLSEQSKVELAAIKKSGDKATLKKIANMLIELQEHPRTGTGQVEHLKHFVFEETWSRRSYIDKHPYFSMFPCSRQIIHFCLNRISLELQQIFPIVIF